MKNLPVPALLFIAFIILTLTFVASLNVSAQTGSLPKYPEIPGVAAPASNFRIASTSLPLKCNFYIWAGSWQLDVRMENTYDGHGNVTEEIMIDGLTGDTIQKVFSQYDGHQNQTQRLVQVLKNGMWQTDFGQRHIFTYNASGKITEDISQEWVGGSWQNRSKITYLFNPAGQLTEETIILWQNGNWTNDTKRITTYQNGVVTAYLVQINGSNGWENFGYFTDYLWNQNTGKVLSYTAKNWANNAWENKNRFSFSYQLTGGYIQTMEAFVNGSWENTLQIHSLQNPANHVYGYQIYDWQNNNWIKVSHQESQHFFDVNNNLTEVIETRWNPNSNAMYNELRMTFFDFQLISSIPDEQEELPAAVYPNPASSDLYVQLASSAETNCQLTDLTGRVVLQQNLQATENRLNLSALASGTYILKLQNKTGAKVSKVVKQ